MASRKLRIKSERVAVPLGYLPVRFTAGTPTRSALAILILVPLVIFGCGRRGALEEPGRAAEAAPPALTDTAPVPGGGDLLNAESPGAQEPDQDRPAAAPERRFFLDPLI